MSAASFAAAPPGGLGLTAPFDWSFLNRAGKVLQAIRLLLSGEPGKSEFTHEEIASVAGCSPKTVQRGMADLRKAGIPLPPVDSSDRTELSTGQDRPVHPSYVLRKSASASNVHVRREETGQICPPPGESLSHTLGRLESNPLAMEACVVALARRFDGGGDKFVPFYRQTCRQVLGGQLAIGELLFALEEAEREGVKCPGKAFIAAVKRRLAEAEARRRPAAPPVTPSPPPDQNPVPPPERPSEPAREALPAVERGPELRARWEALPAEERAARMARVKAANPGIARWDNLLMPLCLAELESSEPPSKPTPTPGPQLRVQVLPTDRELGSLKDLAYADHPEMRQWAREELRKLGRDDVYLHRPFAKAEPAAKPRGLAAGSRQPI